MDWDAAAVLAAIVWLNGVERVPPGALVLRQLLGGAWTAGGASDTDSARWRVVAWWAPLTASLVLPGADAPDARATRATPAAVRRAHRRLTVRLGRARPYVRALRVVGAAELAALVLGLPWATARSGAWGLAVALAAVLVIAAATACIAAVALRRVGVAPRAAARAALTLLSPFAAPRAADLVLERAVADAPADVVARALLPRDAFVALVRPRAWDLQHARTSATPSAADACTHDEHAAALTYLLGADSLASLTALPPAHRASGEPFCPRCGASYRAGVDACADCAGVALILATGD